MLFVLLISLGREENSIFRCAMNRIYAIVIVKLKYVIEDTNPVKFNINQYPGYEPSIYLLNTQHTTDSRQHNTQTNRVYNRHRWSHIVPYKTLAYRMRKHLSLVYMPVARTHTHTFVALATANFTPYLMQYTDKLAHTKQHDTEYQ